MKTRIEKQSDAFKEALWICRHYGLDWRKHIEARAFNGYIAYYFIYDESFSTIIKEIYI